MANNKKKSINVPLWKYEEFIKMQERLEIVKNYILSEEYLNKKVIFSILGEEVIKNED